MSLFEGKSAATAGIRDAFIAAEAMRTAILLMCELHKVSCCEETYSSAGLSSIARESFGVRLSLSRLSRGLGRSFRLDAARSALRSEADLRGALGHVRFGPKTDNRLIMKAEQGSQTEREPRVAGKRWPTGVRRGIRRLNGRLLVPFPCRWVLSCRMVQRDAREFPGSIRVQCPESQRTDRSTRSDG